MRMLRGDPPADRSDHAGRGTITSGIPDHGCLFGYSVLPSTSHACPLVQALFPPQAAQRICAGVPGSLANVPESISMPVETELPVCGHKIMTIFMPRAPAVATAMAADSADGIVTGWQGGVCPLSDSRRPRTRAAPVLKP